MGISGYLTRMTNTRHRSMLLILLTVWVSFASVSSVFRSPALFLDQSRFWIEIGIMAVAMFGVILAGGIDLSVASIMALCGVTILRLHSECGMPIALAALLGLIVGLLSGALNGLIIGFGRIPDLIATLSTMVIFRGVAYLVSQNRVYSNLPVGYRWLGEGTVLTIPVQWFLLIAFSGACLWFFHKSVYGRYVFAIGANREAAVRVGIPVKWVTTGVYALSGLAAAVSALIYTARNNTAKGDDALGFELAVITCVFLGGASMKGGKGTLLGTFLGVLIIGSLRTGLILFGVSEPIRLLIFGSVLIVAASWNSRYRRVS